MSVDHVFSVITQAAVLILIVTKPFCRDLLYYTYLFFAAGKGNSWPACTVVGDIVCNFCCSQ